MCEYDTFLSKKMANCLLVSQKYYNFAPDFR